MRERSHDCFFHGMRRAKKNAPLPSSFIVEVSFMTGPFVRSLVRAARVLSYSVACSLLGACFGGDCLAITSYGFRIRVLDVRTQLPIGPMPTVTITDGTYTEVLTLDPFRPNERLYFGAEERAGTYDVRVEAPGFTPATGSNITVSRQSHCNVLQTVELTIALSANPS